MVAFTGNDPRTATLKNSNTVSGVGIILSKDGTNNKVQLGAATDVPLGVSVGESSRDADQVLETQAQLSPSSQWAEFTWLRLSQKLTQQDNSFISRVVAESVEQQVQTNSLEFMSEQARLSERQVT